MALKINYIKNISFVHSFTFQIHDDFKIVTSHRWVKSDLKKSDTHLNFITDSLQYLLESCFEVRTSKKNL